MVSWGVVEARTVGGVLACGAVFWVSMTSFNDGTLCAEMVCQGDPWLPPVIWLSFNLDDDDG